MADTAHKGMNQVSAVFFSADASFVSQWMLHTVHAGSDMCQDCVVVGSRPGPRPAFDRRDILLLMPLSTMCTVDIVNKRAR